MNDNPSSITCHAPAHCRRRMTIGLVLAGLFLVLNVALPVCVGDFYPFTSAPMFRDAPQQYCNYKIVNERGEPMDPKATLCQRIYDGNPVGYGVGLEPPPVIEEFGCVRTEGELTAHLKKLLQRPEHAGCQALTITQEVIGSHADGSVDVVRVDEVTVSRDAVSVAGSSQQ